MDRAELDEFLDRAEDVLTDWHGSTDAMHARVPESEGAEASPGGSYYEQTAGAVMLTLSVDTTAFSRAMEALRAAVQEVGTAFQRYAERLNPKVPPAVVRHSFRPDYDLRCTAPRCELLAEEH